jgi:hypothetical protein
VEGGSVHGLSNSYVVTKIVSSLIVIKIGVVQFVTYIRKSMVRFMCIMMCVP